jgi:hypothetical protein
MTPFVAHANTEKRMPSELEQIDAKLKSFRATSEKEGRAAQYCKDNRESDPFKMDRERQVHLTVKAAADQEIHRLEFERRCGLPAGGSVGPGEWRPSSPGYFYGSDR